MTDVRAPIFDAVKAVDGGVWNRRGNVATMKSALDRMGVPATDMPPPKPTVGKKTLIGVMGAAAAALFTVTVTQWEGDELVGYRDIVGVATACRGVTGQGVEVGRRYTPAECEVLNEVVAIKHVEPVLACTPNLAGHPEQLAAAASLAYNIGAAGYCRSTVDRRFDAGDWRGACDAILAWNKAGGRVVRGLENRRRAERNLCLKNLPKG